MKFRETATRDDSKSVRIRKCNNGDAPLPVNFHMLIVCLLYAPTHQKDLDNI
jgi:hypothetical protein